MFQPPKASLSFKGQIQTVTYYKNEGMQKQRKDIKIIVQQWVRVQIPPQEISLNYSMRMKTPTQVEDSNFRRSTSTWALAGRLRIETLGTLSYYLTTNQSEEGHTP